MEEQEQQQQQQAKGGKLTCAKRGRNASAVGSVGTDRVDVDADINDRPGSDFACPSPMTMSTHLPQCGSGGADGIGVGGFQFGIGAGVGLGLGLGSGCGLTSSPSTGLLAQHLQGGNSPQPTRTGARSSRKRFRRDRVSIVQVLLNLMNIYIIIVAI